MSTKLVPNETGLVDIRIDREDALAGYFMVEDWDGTEHKIALRSNEGDVITLPVPKLRKKTATHKISES
jgi:hypothetical protein